MKLSELIAKYGDEKVQFQNLDQCAKTINFDAKKGTSITFGTTESISTKPGEGMRRLGLVLWFDREDVARVIADQKGPRHD